MTANDTTTANNEKALSINCYDILDYAAEHDEPFLAVPRLAEYAGGDRADARDQLEAMERNGLLHSKETGGVRIWWFSQHNPGDLDEVRQWRQMEADVVESQRTC